MFQLTILLCFFISLFIFYDNRIEDSFENFFNQIHLNGAHTLENLLMTLNGIDERAKKNIRTHKMQASNINNLLNKLFLGHFFGARDETN